MTHKEAADFHKVKPVLVSRIMRSMKKDPEYISKREDKMKCKQEVRERVEIYVTNKINHRSPIESAREVTEALNGPKGGELKTYRVNHILRYDLGLRYKPLLYGAPEANTERCMVLRQQFAIRFLQILKDGKRVYNIDESWIDSMNYTRGHWRPRLYAMKGNKAVSPRISLIACVGTDGSSSYCLT
jgi:hypothetical protein